MSVYSGPEISNDGLVLCLDAANIRSYNPNLVTTVGAFNYPIGGTVSLDLAPNNTTVLCKHDLTGLSGPFMNTRVDRTLIPGTYTISAWLKGTTSFGGAFAYVGETTGEIYATTANITTEWQRFTFTFTVVTTQNNNRVQLFFGSQGDNKIVSIWGVELVAGSTPTPNYILSDFRGTTLYNLNGASNNGSLINGVGYTSLNGGGLLFNGVNTRIDLTTEFGSVSQYTILYWAKRDADGRMPISTINADFYWFGDNSWRYVHGGVGGEYYYPKPTSIPLGSWGQYAVTYDGSKVIIYRQGVYQGEQSTTGTVNFSSALRIGWWGSNSFAYQGTIPQVSFYNRALSAAEVQQNFQALRGRFGI